MSKQPPVPADNQSPYPIQEPPHDHSNDDHPAEGEALKAARAVSAQKARWSPSARDIGIGAAVGVGSAAIVAGLLFWRGNRKDGK